MPLSDGRRTVSAMTLNTVVKAELRRFPKGPRNSPERALRASFAAARLNSLGCRAQIAPTFEAAYETALRCVRAAAPEWATFTPTLAESAT